MPNKLAISDDRQIGEGPWAIFGLVTSTRHAERSADELPPPVKKALQINTVFLAICDLRTVAPVARPEHALSSKTCSLHACRSLHWIG